jgi:hypothetical protein
MCDCSIQHTSNVIGPSLGVWPSPGVLHSTSLTHSLSLYTFACLQYTYSILCTTFFEAIESRKYVEMGHTSAAELLRRDLPNIQMTEFSVSYHT